MLSVWMIGPLLWTGPAWATVDEDCDELARPADYDEQVQRDFLNNYVALATTLSAIHAPIPHRAGHGALGLDLLGIPPLGCGQRYVEGWTKTEDTNKTPVAPRARATFTFQPLLGRIFPFAGVGIVPPVPINGTRTALASAELGAGAYLGERLELSLRGHGTLQRTVGDVATAYVEGDPAFDDLYFASTAGADLAVGVELGPGERGPRLVPYASIGLVKASTFFWIGDDGVVTPNLHPYRGPAASLGADARLGAHLRLGAELYVAPGGHTLSEPEAETVSEGSFSRYGHLTTVRLRVAAEL